MWMVRDGVGEIAMGISLDFIYLKAYGLLYRLHNYFTVVILEHYGFILFITLL